MSIKRRLVLLTEAQWAQISFGAQYAVESCVDDHGDIPPRKATAIGKALIPFDAAPRVNLKAIADALRKAVEVMLEECSCANRVGREPDDHDTGCWIVIWRHDLERLRALHKILSEAL